MDQHPYYVLEIHRPGRPPEQRSINAKRQVIGRDGGDIVLHDPEASAMHAEIEFENGQMVVRDLGSSNGTWKGSDALPQFAMSAGQEFKCGHTIIRVTHIVGGQPLAGGGTVLGDANILAELKAQKAALAAGAAPGGAAPQKPGPGAGLFIALAVGLVVVVGGGAFAAYILFASKDVEVDEVAQAEEGDTDQPEPETIVTPIIVPIAPPEDNGPVVEKDLGELYQQVGAATVLIRVPGSVGSGAIIDPRGVVLTNNHVIDSGQREGLRIRAKVTMGTYSEESRAFEPSADALDAYVLKIDVDHDLALIELENPPENLPSISLSGVVPYPGQRVAAVGHAGAGLLWAIKGGEISSTGKLSGHTELALEEAEGFHREILQDVKEKMDKQGRVIQSTAKILPGDSGGPLVDPQGQLVGVNAFGRIDRATGQWLSFHVHLAEVQAFVEDIPDHPLDHIPDPWELKEAKPKFADVDHDGIPETLVATSLDGMGSATGYFLDLDQSSLTKGADLPEWEDLADEEKRPFDAELIVLFQDGKRHYWYDSDGDDAFDIYMLDEGTGRVSDAYRVTKEKGAEEENSLWVADGLDAKFFEDAAVKERFSRIGPVVFPGSVEPASGAAAVPDPLAPAGADALTSLDADRDGTDDTYSQDTMFHRRRLWDLDQNAGGSVSAMTSALDGGSADVEVAAVAQGRSAWVWYDRNNDGQFDLLLESSNLDGGVATKAFELGAGGAMKQIEQGVGERLLVPGRIADAAQRARLSDGGSLGPQALATDDAMGRFPAVTVSTLGSVVMSEREEFPNSIAIVTERDHDMTLIDIDQSSVKGKKNHGEAAKLVRAGDFDAEFVLYRIGHLRWAFYDTDNEDGFDRVMFAGADGRLAPTVAYTVDGDSLVAAEPGPSLVRWGLFTDKKLRERFETLAPLVFPSEAAE